MNRRNFLKGFAVASAGALLLPERKIWALDQTMVRVPDGLTFDQLNEWGSVGGIYRAAYSTNVASTKTLTLEQLLDHLQPFWDSGYRI